MLKFALVFGLAPLIPFIALGYVIMVVWTSITDLLGIKGE
jgi:hypothetical protein